MDIKLDNTHVLKSDPYCYYIVRLVEPKGKKLYEKRVSGYCRNLSEAMKSYIETKIRSSEATTLAELSEAVETLKAEVADFCTALQETLEAYHD